MPSEIPAGTMPPYEFILGVGTDDIAIQGASLGPLFVMNGGWTQSEGSSTIDFSSSMPLQPGGYCIDLWGVVPGYELEMQGVELEACGIEVDSPPPAGVSVSPSSLTLALNGSQSLSASGTPSGGTYSWSAASGVTIVGSANSSSVTIQGSSIGTATVSVTYTAPNGQVGVASATVNVVKVMLTSVLWGGSGKQAMFKSYTDWTTDPLATAGTTAIGTSSSNAEYQDPNATGSPTVVDPVAYVMGSVPTMTATVLVSPTNTVQKFWVQVNAIYVVNPNLSITYPYLSFAPATASGGTSGKWAVQLTSTALPSQIINDRVYFDWSVSFDGVNYTPFGQSVTTVFTIYRASLNSSSDYWVNSLSLVGLTSQLLTVTADRINYATGVLSRIARRTTRRAAFRRTKQLWTQSCPSSPRSRDSTSIKRTPSLRSLGTIG